MLRRRGCRRTGGERSESPSFWPQSRTKSPSMLYFLIHMVSLTLAVRAPHSKLETKTRLPSTARRVTCSTEAGRETGPSLRPRRRSRRRAPATRARTRSRAASSRPSGRGFSFLFLRLRPTRAATERERARACGAFQKAASLGFVLSGGRGGGRGRGEGQMMTRSHVPNHMVTSAVCPSVRPSAPEF